MAKQEIWRMFLHWSATKYDWRDKNHYHCVVTGDGVAHWLHQPDEYLSAHTYARNRNAVAFSLACMGGRGFDDYPPTQKQINTMCVEIAKLARKQGWTEDKLDLKHIMTHAEAAALRDFPVERVEQAGTSDSVAQTLGMPHGNYGPMNWYDGWPGGSAERWDLAQLSPKDKMGVGGVVLRKKILEEYRKLGKK